MHTQLRFLTTLLWGLCVGLAAPAMQLAEVIWEMLVKMYSPIYIGSLLQG